VLEAGFLVLLAVVVGLADLDPWLIVLVMAVGWLLVSLIEYFAWRQVRAVTLSRFEPAPSEAVVQESVVEDVPPPPPPPPPEPPAPEPAAEEETVVQPAAPEEKETIAEADDRVTAARQSFADVQEEERKRHRLDPLQPRPRRRWILFGPYEKRETPGEREEEQ
jgi:cytoskeletal protein RodZ